MSQSPKTGMFKPDILTERVCSPFKKARKNKQTKISFGINKKIVQYLFNLLGGNVQL